MARSGAQSERENPLTRRVVLLISATLVFALPTHAAEVKYSPQYDRCMDASGGNDAAMMDCITAETGAWDKRLNENYKKLTATLEPDRKKALTAAEVAWLKFRDANCSFVSDPDGGTEARIAGDDCFMRMTAERTTELKALLDPPGQPVEPIATGESASALQKPDDCTPTPAQAARYGMTITDLSAKMLGAQRLGGRCQDVIESFENIMRIKQGMSPSSATTRSK